MSGFVGAIAGRIAEAVREAQAAQAQALAQAAAAAAARERQRLAKLQPAPSPPPPANATATTAGTRLAGAAAAGDDALPTDPGAWVRAAFRGGPALLGAVIVAEALAQPLALRRPDH